MWRSGGASVYCTTSAAYAACIRSGSRSRSAANWSAMIAWIRASSVVGMMSSSLGAFTPMSKPVGRLRHRGGSNFGEAEMKYLIMVLSNPESAAALRRLSAEQGREFGLRHRALSEALADSGELVVSEGLDDQSNAVRVRV